MCCAAHVHIHTVYVYTQCVSPVHLSVSHTDTQVICDVICAFVHVSTCAVSYSSARVKNSKQARCQRHDRAVATMSSFEDECCLETLTAIVDDIETDINNVIIDGGNVYKYCLLISCNVIIGG